MSYDYETEKHKIFTDEGQRKFLKVRDKANELLEKAGAFMMFKPLKDMTDDSWQLIAYIDRLVELGEIKEITRPDTAGQHRVFVKTGN